LPKRSSHACADTRVSHVWPRMVRGRKTAMMIHARNVKYIADTDKIAKENLQICRNFSFLYGFFFNTEISKKA